MNDNKNSGEGSGSINKKMGVLGIECLWKRLGRIRRYLRSIRLVYSLLRRNFCSRICIINILKAGLRK